MQALENYEREIKKAFQKMEADMEQHKGVFKRLEEDLKTVKVFEAPDYTEALQMMREQDSDLYAAIRQAYIREQFENNPDRHCQGIMAAVNAIYNLGYANGFNQGAEDAQKG